MKEFNFCQLKVVKERTIEYKPISSPSELADFFVNAVGAGLYDTEHLYSVALDSKGHPVAFFETSIGDISSSICSPSAIFRRMCSVNAAALALVHCHPSQCEEALCFSKEDIAATNRIKEAGLLLQIPLVDHIIVSGMDWISAKREGIL